MDSQKKSVKADVLKQATAGVGEKLAIGKMQEQQEGAIKAGEEVSARRRRLLRQGKAGRRSMMTSDFQGITKETLG